jgi:hypothetical protein
MVHSSSMPHFGDMSSTSHWLVSGLHSDAGQDREVARDVLDGQVAVLVVALPGGRSAPTDDGAGWRGDEPLKRPFEYFRQANEFERIDLPSASLDLGYGGPVDTQFVGKVVLAVPARSPSFRHTRPDVEPSLLLSHGAIIARAR